MIRKLGLVLGPQLAARVRRNVALAAVTAVLQGLVFALLVPALKALLGNDPGSVWPWLLVLAAVAAAYGIAHYVSVVAGYRLGSELSEALHRRLGDHVAQLPLGWFEPARAGALGRLATKGVLQVMNAPAHLLVPLVSAFITPATVAVAMVFFDWRIAAATVATAPFLAVVYRWGARTIQRNEQTMDAAAGETGARVVEFARTQPVLRAFGRTAGGYSLLERALAGQRTADLRLLVSGVVGVAGFALAVQAGFTAVLMIGVMLALGGSLGTAELLALLVLAVRFVEPMMLAATHGASLTMVRNTLDRMLAVLATKPLPEPTRPADAPGTDIEFDNVRFGYDADRCVLTGFSFRAPAGGVTALVGPSGAGKTTVLRLIARFFDVDAGAVRVGGVDVRDLATADLMAKVSLVFQDVYLFDGTIADNIRIGREGATDEEVHEAARLARVTEIVDRLPDGWHSRVGEGGAALSGGERQRISIARAIVKAAPIVLLDEATSALDPHHEAAVLDALSALTAGRTVLVVAHRLSTVVTADQIIVVDGGRVAEYGRHEDLLAAGGRYAAFWAERQRASGWRLTASAARGR